MEARPREALRVLPNSKPLSPDEAVLKEDSGLKLSLFRKRIMLEMLYSRHINTRTMGLFLALADGINDVSRPSMAELFPEMDAMPRGKQRRAAKKDKAASRALSDPALPIKAPMWKFSWHHRPLHRAPPPELLPSSG